MMSTPRVSPAVEEIPIGDDGTRIANDPAPPTTPVQGHGQPVEHAKIKLNAAQRLAKDK